MTTWSYDHMITWPYDHTITRWFDHTIIWSHDPMTTWSFYHMIIWLRVNPGSTPGRPRSGIWSGTLIWHGGWSGTFIWYGGWSATFIWYCSILFECLQFITFYTFWVFAIYHVLYVFHFFKQSYTILLSSNTRSWVRLNQNSGGWQSTYTLCFLCKNPAEGSVYDWSGFVYKRNANLANTTNERILYLSDRLYNNRHGDTGKMIALELD